MQKNRTGICAAFWNVIIQRYSHYNINTARLVTGSNSPNILYSYFVIYNRGTSRKSDDRGATALCLNYKTVKINRFFSKSFCYNILWICTFYTYVYLYLYKVNWYLEIKAHISFEQILVNPFLHPVDIATCVKCKIHKEQKEKECLKCLQ